jgi:hypothetical protein
MMQAPELRTSIIVPGKVRPRASSTARAGTTAPANAIPMMTSLPMLDDSDRLSFHVLQCAVPTVYNPWPQKLEIPESCCLLMMFMHGLSPAKVVFNTKRGSEEQSDCRSAARNLTLRLESQ